MARWCELVDMCCRSVGMWIGGSNVIFFIFEYSTFVLVKYQSFSGEIKKKKKHVRNVQKGDFFFLKKKLLIYHSDSSSGKPVSP